VPRNANAVDVWPTLIS
jgi:hypothetical protein